MKKYIIAALCAAFTLVSCQQKMEPAGQHERVILSIAFEGQIGASVIETLDAETGTVNVKVADALVDDINKVKIASLVVSYGATSSASKGDVLDFTTGRATLTVTAQSGEVRTYSIIRDIFTEDFVGCYSITGSMMVGGLGGADGFNWGCMELCDPTAKSWSWNATGYGPEAQYDDYFEITLDTINPDGSTEGTCVLYGGVDGKNWNCIMAGASNKAVPGLDIDLHKYYRVIPLGTSHWKRDYSAGTITFSDAEGHSAETTLLDEDYVVGYKGTDPRTVVVNDLCLARRISDGNYAWEEAYLYTDYQKFSQAVLGFFILISKVDEIPAASKTECDEGDITITPVEPVDDPDKPDKPDTPDPPQPTDNPYGAYEGSYKVKTLLVYGPAGSGAWIAPWSKPWSWNGYVDGVNWTTYIDGSGGWWCNAGYETDNTLEIAFTSFDAKTATGTVNYGAGADGQFWDYTYNPDKNLFNNGLDDLSFNYAQLPQGESAFTMGANTGGYFTSHAITITGGGKGELLEAGFTAEITGTNAKYEIPSGCFGIAFSTKHYDAQYPDCPWNDSWDHWTDFERFLFAPEAYLMVFEKQ